MEATLDHTPSRTVIPTWFSKSDGRNMKGSDDPPSFSSSSDLTSRARLVAGGKEKNWRERRREVGTLPTSITWELLAEKRENNKFQQWISLPVPSHMILDKVHMYLANARSCTAI